MVRNTKLYTTNEKICTFSKVFFCFWKKSASQAYQGSIYFIKKTVRILENFWKQMLFLETKITNFRFYFILNIIFCNVHYNVKVLTVTKSILAE